MEPQPGTPLAAALSHASCSRCGYDLTGLDQGGNCPECGQSIAQTLDSRLENAEPAWLREQALTILLLISLCALGYENPDTGSNGGIYINLAARVAIATVALIACWRLSRPDPRRAHTEGQSATQRGLRVSIIAYVAGLIMWIPGVFGDSRTWMLLYYAWLAVLVLSSWLAFLIVLQQARRTSDASLILHARIAVWTLPLSKILAYGSPITAAIFSRFTYQSLGTQVIVTLVFWATYLTPLVAVALLGRMHEVFRAAAATSTPAHPNDAP